MVRVGRENRPGPVGKRSPRGGGGRRLAGRGGECSVEPSTSRIRWGPGSGVHLRAPACLLALLNAGFPRFPVREGPNVPTRIGQGLTGALEAGAAGLRRAPSPRDPWKRERAGADPPPVGTHQASTKPVPGAPASGAVSQSLLLLLLLLHPHPCPLAHCPLAEPILCALKPKRPTSSPLALAPSPSPSPMSTRQTGWPPEQGRPARLAGAGPSWARAGRADWPRRRAS